MKKLLSSIVFLVICSTLANSAYALDVAQVKVFNYEDGNVVIHILGEFESLPYMCRMQVNKVEQEQSLDIEIVRSEQALHLCFNVEAPDYIELIHTQEDFKKPVQLSLEGKVLGKLELRENGIEFTAGQVDLHDVLEPIYFQ